MGFRLLLRCWLARMPTVPQKGKDAVFSEVDGFTMVFDGRYKLVVESASEKPVEMYDCQNDPCELNNVFEDANLESVRQDLIETHLSTIRDRLDREKLEVYRADSGKGVFSTGIENFYFLEWVKSPNALVDWVDYFFDVQMIWAIQPTASIIER